MWGPEIIEFAGRFLNSPPTYWQASPLPELPTEDPLLEQVPDALEGSSPRPRISCRCFEHVQSFGEPPSEDELIAHFIVPFFVRSAGLRNGSP